MDWFVFDFIIFSYIDEYDDVFGDLEWLQVRICMKREGKIKIVMLEILAKQGRVHD